MNERVKKLWLKALRSGRYVQGRGQLVKEGRTRDKFCCLGVLTNLYVEETGDADVWRIEHSILSDRVKDWAGLASYNPPLELKRDGLSFPCTATEANDGQHKSFKVIANAIEECL